MSEPLLEVTGVDKSFPGVRALHDMRLDLRSGEVLALVGENGAGKSTLMKLLSGIHSADAGEFRLRGEPLSVSGPRQALELGISIIHQEFNLVPHLTVAQNIFIGREPRRWKLLLDERRLNAEAGELLDRLRLPLDPKAVVGTLTVANQQMTEIAKALAHDPVVLIMDEPTAALNDAEVETLHGLIRRFVGHGTGAIYISHRMEEIRRIADRVTVIRDGEYMDTLRVSSASTDRIISLMVGRAIDTTAQPSNVRADRAVVLEARGLSTATLLTDVGFDLRHGEILGFAGLMGAGRTEVARALVGADPLTSGSVVLHGEPVRIANPSAAARHGIGYLSEDRKRFGLLLEQDVKANITLACLRDQFATAGFVNDGAARAKAQEYLATLRIKTPSLDQITKHLSGGNQQKVVIAKWLAKDCDILIFDEPTRGIDVGAKEEIYQLLNELAARGKSIIMISSELPEILRMSHRVVVMSEGRVTRILGGSQATQENIMHYATLRPDKNAEDAAELGITDVHTGHSRKAGQP
ncbi:D-xylose ABC transporter ATP-binding protein [Prauserella marina]|uniref:Ribose transport system ATP-binding protein n=1 Tax=Prauserella marina TaxID=530584 RepID=A0A222VM33_9PSEU|nr:sugar ABC transporter ATP-binding protein [Prauserella marina]ASR34990.1 D-xylose ABC transporter ATP-binding protein [Prauserella marina]PWV85283.1 monosaccharide ABC transporter ATP-binding protein (CUT2 family) [Prauserella marina]SDC00615.1 ribose transport system ATP-binding protein [Prauserella marina]